jgi:hypothetical protein
MQLFSGSIYIVDDVAVVVARSEQDELNLKFALVEYLDGNHLIPDSVLDDWGREIKGAALYSWIQENGLRFPRAEIFGHRPDGQPVQRFLREIDLSARYSCYAYLELNSDIEDGILIRAIIRPDQTLQQPKLEGIPAPVPGLLSMADIQWWEANPDQPGQIDQIISRLEDVEPQSPRPGN